MKIRILALFLGLTVFPLFAADPPFELLVARVKFDDTKPLMIVAEYGKTGELAIGSAVQLDLLSFFEGRRLVVKTEPSKGS